MNYVLLVRPSVTTELVKIHAYREQESKGSGDRFLDLLAECYTSIKKNPYGYQLRKDDYRHAMLKRLKYRVVFKVQGNNIYVVQVRHMSRKVSRTFGP